MSEQPVERWVVTAEGRPGMRPFMIIDQEQESWARELHQNMGPGRWVNAKVWHYFDGELRDVTSITQATEPLLSTDADSGDQAD